jgi:imidazoleglycerol-phosphate dehydratase
MKITFLLTSETNLLDWLLVFEPMLRLQKMSEAKIQQIVCTADSALPAEMQTALTLLSIPIISTKTTEETDILVLAGLPDIGAGCALTGKYTKSALCIITTPNLKIAPKEGKLDGNLWQILEEIQQGVTVVGSKTPIILVGEGARSTRAIGLALCILLTDEVTCRKVAEKMGVELPERTVGIGERVAMIERKTAETWIQARVAIDGSGKHSIQTGLPFLDHMLTQVAVHGLFDLDIQANGDLEVDAHHTVEDVGLTLGKAFDLALGERRGLIRMASYTVPMDESLAMVVVDFSGRPYTVFDVEWYATEVGNISTTLVKHFFESFSIQARCNLHVRLLSGEDDHHRAEAIFKAFGRALDAATQIDPRRLGSLPSSKGAL